MPSSDIYLGIKYTSRTQEHFDLGVCDRRGRRIGARITYVIAETGSASSQRRWLAPAGSPVSGVIYGMTVHATRDERDYGASQPWRFFLSEASRDAARGKYLDGAKLRARKK